jgi:sulfatase modifying factor 1
VRADPRSIAAWLERLAADRLVERSARTALDVERLLRLREVWAPEALGQSLASLLAKDEETYRKVLEHFRLTFALPVFKESPEARQNAGNAAAPGTEARRDAPRLTQSAKQAPKRRPLDPLRHLAWKLPGLAWAAILAFIVISGILILPRAVRDVVMVAISTLQEPASPSEGAGAPASIDPGANEALKTPAPPPGPRIEVVLGPKLYETQLPSSAPAAPPGPGWLRVLLALASALLGVLAVQFWLAGRAYDDDVRDAAQRAKDERKRLMGATSTLGVPYHVERAPPLPEGDIDDSATLLGRIARREEGFELDVPATIDRTIDTGGRIIPVYAAGGRREALLIFVDVEDGSHPYLDGVEWVLDRWKRLGLAFVRYDYSYRPVDLFRKPDGKTTSITELGRRTEGMPLLIFSRMAKPEDYDGRPTWLRRLAPWPNRAWLDLDPRSRGERKKDAQRVLDQIAYARLLRFPFTRDGLSACAAALTGSGRKLRSPRERELRKGDEIKKALWQWAAVACCVPDPDWAHLDSLRRSIRAIGDVLPDPRYVQRLIDWVREEGYADGTPGDGSCIRFRKEARVELIARLRRFDQERFPEDLQGERLEHQARKLLIQQLRAADVHDDEFERVKRDMKAAVHEAVLSPKRAARLLEEFADTAVAQELRGLLAEEHRVQEVVEEASSGDATHEAPRRRGEGVEGWSAATREPIRAWVAGEGHGKARLRDLARPSGWRGRHPVAATVVLAMAGASWGGWWLWVGSSPAPQVRRVMTPSTYKVSGQEQSDLVETGHVALAKDAPMRFVRVPGGEFLMGSPPDEPGRRSDERLHPAKVESFEIAVHEVTQKQWILVMGTRPFMCFYGCGDDLPAQMVDWFDAAKFMNALTDRENKERSARRTPLTQCYNEGPWSRVPRCTGYRLPTETEWEYAARAGTQTAYSFGNDAKGLCAYGNGAEQMAKGPSQIVNDCSDGYPFLAPVGKFGANRWGLYDVHGNVEEWVWDGFGVYPEHAEAEYEGPVTKAGGVGRGGSFAAEPTMLRSSYRSYLSRFNAQSSVGFRCARSVPYFDSRGD